MKIKITYSPEEDAIAQGLTSIIESFFNLCKVKKVNTDEKYKHIYVSVKRRTKEEKQ